MRLKIDKITIKILKKTEIALRKICHTKKCSPKYISFCPGNHKDCRERLDGYTAPAWLCACRINYYVDYISHTIESVYIDKLHHYLDMTMNVFHISLLYHSDMSAHRRSELHVLKHLLEKLLRRLDSNMTRWKEV